MANWNITPGMGAAQVVRGGKTGKGIAEGFIRVDVTGIREVAMELQRLAAIAGDHRLLENHVKNAAKLIEKGYKSQIKSATGNLKRSVTTRTKKYESSGAVIAITGPVQTGTAASSERQASGNHAWLYEFGTGPRKPGSRGRRTYINVHQAINGKMKRHSSANDEQFARMAKGNYFLMGSKNVPGRESGRGAFVQKPGGGTRPFYLAPGETYGAMPASGAMEKAIYIYGPAVFNSLKSAIENSLASMKK